MKEDNPPCRNPKNDYLERFNGTIIQWAEDYQDKIIAGRREYSWGGKPLIECINERNRISSQIVLSRIRNAGGVDLETLHSVMSWGGFGSFPLEDNDEALRITQKAFHYVDEGDLKGAIYELLKIYSVGIASASKVIGLFDPNSLAIYDSRVGTALRNLKHNDVRLIKCPSGRTRPGDACTNKKWAENYEKLIWTLEIMRDHLNNQGYPFNIADVEMALFMMGK